MMCVILFPGNCWQELAASLLQQLQSKVEFRSTDQVVTQAQLRAAAVVLVEASSVPAVEAELVRQGKLCCRTASTGLQVHGACVMCVCVQVSCVYVCRW